MRPVYTSSGVGRKLNVPGIPMVLRLHGRDTGGVVSAVESHDVPGGGPPPHIHSREDETFRISLLLSMNLRCDFQAQTVQPDEARGVILVAGPGRVGFHRGVHVA